MSVEKIIAAAMDKNAVELREHFDSAMKERIRTALDEKRKEVEEKCSCEDEEDGDEEEKEDEE
jgi:hypothetical protein